MTDRLDHWARHASYRTFLAQRDGRGQWRNVTYAETQYFARRVGQALLNRGLSVERPVVILSGNDIEHALLGLGAMYAGIPYVPLSPSYSLASDSYDALRHIFELMTPGLVFVSVRPRFEKALRAVIPKDTELVVNDSSPGATDFSNLVNVEPEGAIEAAAANVHANTIIKILFADDSSESAKGVIYTHRMWSSSQQMLRHCLPVLTSEPPVLVDSLPWSSSPGGNTSVGLALYNGGSLYIDQDTEGQFEETIRNLRAVAPTVYRNTASSFEVLLSRLQSDEKLAKHFFSRLRLLCCDGGDPSSQVLNGFHAAASGDRVEGIPILTLLGPNETTSTALFRLQSKESRGSVGLLPSPGVEVKLVRANTGFDVSFRGPNVTLGYWRQLNRTRAAFDEEGFFRSEGLVQVIDPTDLSQGFSGV
jgi:feruloyl-CoA synthase